MARSVRFATRSPLRLRVNVTAEVHDAVTGRLVSRQQMHNLVVTAGLNLIRNYLAGTAVAPTRLAVGTSATAVTPSQTALVAQVFDDIFTQVIATTDGVVTYKYFLGSASANGNTLREAGLFTVTPTMFARVVLSAPIVKTALVTVTFAWTVTLAAS